MVDDLLETRNQRSPEKIFVYRKVLALKTIKL